MKNFLHENKTLILVLVILLFSIFVVLVSDENVKFKDLGTTDFYLDKLYDIVGENPVKHYKGTTSDGREI